MPENWDEFAETWNKEPTFPWVYRASKVNLVLSGALALFFAFAAVDLHRQWPFSILAAITSLGCAYGCWYAQSGKLILSENALEICRPLWTTTILRKEIKGRRTIIGTTHNSYPYNKLITTSGASVTINMNGWFDFDHYFIRWINSIPIVYDK